MKTIVKIAILDGGYMVQLYHCGTGYINMAYAASYKQARYIALTTAFKGATA